MTKKVLLSTFEQEIGWVFKEVKSLIETGIKPEEIAVISYQNKTLSKFYEYFIKNQIAVNFRQSGNILELPIIQQILIICEFINSLLTNNQEPANDLLPEILSYEFWQVSDSKIWEISLISNQKKQTWLQTMLQDSELNLIAAFLIQLGREAKTQPADFIVHAILGNQEVCLERDFLQANQDFVFVCPLKEFYFNSSKINQSYLKNLSAIQTLYSAIADHFRRQKFDLKDLVTFVKLLKINKIGLYDKSNYQTTSGAINLLTAHSAKGLEFEKVFVVNCSKNEWQKRAKSSKIHLPKYLNLAPEKEDNDDFIRLFYVATTRAKDNLYLTAHQNENGKNLDLFEFIDHDFEVVEFSEAESEKILTTVLEPERNLQNDPTKLELLQSRLQDFRLSYSDLITFLDVPNGGPQTFLKNQLLAFPRPETIYQVYGNSVHNALKSLFSEWKQTKNLPNQEFFLSLFEKYLGQERPKSQDYTKLLKKGKIELPIFYENSKKFWSINSLVEYSFFEQNIALGNTRLSGRTDRIDFDDEAGKIVVVDYKTAKPITWQTKDPTKKIKLWKYETQLGFYEVLIKHSNFAKKYPNFVGQVEFIEADPEGKSVVLNKQISQEEIQILENLIQKVYQKITTLDFPDVADYAQNLQGIKDFKQDLLEGRV